MRPDSTGLQNGDSDTDVLVVGGGPAGLTAAIYLARFHLDVVVADRGGGRALSIPKTRNHAGFPDGVSGEALIDRMRRQAASFGAQLIDAEVSDLARDGDGFVASIGALRVRARAVLLATGVSNNRPPMEAAAHDTALRQGLIRYCPICDGFEVTDARVGVLGVGERGANEAIFLRGYTSDVTLMAPEGPHDPDDPKRKMLDDAGVRMVDGPCSDITIDGSGISVATPGGRLTFDTIYPALGSRIHSELAAQLGPETSDEGCMSVDRHQRTNIAGLYAAGDVVIGLDQISHAMGEGGVAATTIRNDLAERFDIFRAARSP